MLLSSCVLIIAVALILLSANVLGTVQADPSSISYVVFTLHPEYASQHKGFFSIISALLGLGAMLGFIDIRKPLARIFFLFSFSVCSGIALKCLAFPAALSVASVQEDGDEPASVSVLFNWMTLYCVVSAYLATTAVFHALSSTSSEYYSRIALVLWTILPFSLVCYLVFKASWWPEAVSPADQITESIAGILWVACCIPVGILVCTSGAEIMKDYSSQPIERSVNGRGKNHARQSKTAVVSLYSAMVAIMYVTMSTFYTPHMPSRDVIIPLSTLLLALTRRGMLMNAKTHPIAISLLLSSLWWVLSSFHSLFIKGMGDTDVAEDAFAFRLWSFDDGNVSIWESPSPWMPLMNMVLLLLPIPVIYLSFLHRRGDSEDVIFILSVLSGLSVVAAQLWSIRLLAILGVVYGLWRCRQISTALTQSQRHI